MSTMDTDVYNAFRSLGVEDEKALKAAEALSRRDTDVVGLQKDFAVLRWMVGANIGLSLVIIGGVFFA